MTTPYAQFRLDPDPRDKSFLRGTVHHVLTSLSSDTITALPQPHTARDVPPPTNRWFSGLAFAEPRAVFPMPYSYQQTTAGFTFGLPKVVSSRHSVSGSAVADIDVNVGARSHRIASFDLASVTIEFLNEIGRVLGRATLAEGVPYISYEAEVPHELALSVPFAMSYENLATYSVSGRDYGMVTSGKYTSRAIKLKTGDFVSLIALPNIVDEALSRKSVLHKLATCASYPVQRTEVTATHGPDQVHTTIRYVAKDNGPVAVVRMPHHGPSSEPSVGQYSTVSGTVSLHLEKMFSWSTPAVEPAAEPDLSGLDARQLATLSAQVTLDLQEPPRAPLDTYYAGKALLRDVNLLGLAEQLEVAGAPEFRAELEERFLVWMDPQGVDRQDDRFFVHEPQWCGVVGMQASFGADQFNDHHIQNGYFLYVGALLAKSNPQFLERAQLVIDALAWDVAAPIENSWVPMLRVFDPYKGHSWSSGLADTDDGNKQETSAEAINCWNGLALWSQVTKNPAFEAVARWMLALEVQSSLAYWTNVNLDDPVMRGYQHCVIPQVWGGKHEYATWFSADPPAMLGAIILPFTGVSTYLAADVERITANLESVIGYFNDYDVYHGDYLLMYSSLRGASYAQEAQRAAVDYPQDLIDDANSRSYLLAWAMVHSQ
ncbi:glycosyl hydrolase [Jonesiaceae bacterium BS-20]|uniref:glucan endo-1,3-beta-D-glucosidase n=1 Tax=Jonesiaceae bacterium BS-20 TaxID=3120821 RepID=A0AAU7DTT6_9MICO